MPIPDAMIQTTSIQGFTAFVRSTLRSLARSLGDGFWMDKVVEFRHIHVFRWFSAPGLRNLGMANGRWLMTNGGQAAGLCICIKGAT